MSNQIKISFPDSSVKEYKSGISSLEIAKSISNSLAKKILVASFNDVHIDLSTELTENGSIKFFTWDDIEGKKTFWHSSAHLLAEAVESLYPGVKFGIGPPIDNGFYYDIDLENKLTEEDVVVVIFHDHGSRYVGKIYNDDWMKSVGFL